MKVGGTTTKDIQIKAIIEKIKNNIIHQLFETSYNAGYYKRELLQVEYNRKKNASENI